jgi:hypothetical protein
MYIVILTNILAILFAFLEGKKIVKNGLLVSFFILFVFLALRFDYGNDYMMYYEGFENINKVGWFEVYNEKMHFEPGWIVLCVLFEPIGFFGLVAFLSFLYCYVFYKLIHDYVPIKLYWLAVFILVFSTGNLLVHLSAMRQTLVIVIFIYSLRFIFRKQLLLYCAAIILASTFHSSALILLPIYFLQFLNFKINKWSGGAIIIIYIALYLLGQQIRPFLNLLILSFHEDYLYYDEEGSFNSGLGLIINTSIFILILANDKYYEGKLSFFFKLGIISYILSPFGLIIMLIGRIQLYFSLFLIVVYPLVYDSKIYSYKIIIFRNTINDTSSHLF